MSSLMSSLPKETIRGITLNNQHFDLFEIIDDESKAQTEKVDEVVSYLEKSKSTGSKKLPIGELITKYVNYTAEKLSMKSEEQKQLLQAIADNVESVFNRKKFLEVLREYGFENPETVNSALMEATDVTLTRTKEGIVDFLVTDKNGQVDKEKSYAKVKAFYDHVLSGTYDRIDLDDTAAPSGYLTIQGDSVRPKKLEKAIRFCEEHGLSAKVNSAFFYLHSHYPQSPALKTREDLMAYYQTYLSNISQRMENSSAIEEMDVFNEFVYRDQPQKVGEDDFQYGERHNGFHAKLSLEDICNLVKQAREIMPSVKFLYNDDGWDKPVKREGIFREIEKIRRYEDYEHQLINSIGMQFHTSINVDIAEIRRAVEECRERFPDIDVKITELDIGEKISGFNYETATPEELAAAQIIASSRKKQMMNELLSLAREGQISEVTLWSQSDEMSFKGKETKSSLNSYDVKTNTYYGKETELTPEEIEKYDASMEIVMHNVLVNLARTFKTNNIGAFEKNLSEFMPEAKKYFSQFRDEISIILKEQAREPVQDFNLHTHTQRCGHAADFTEDYEFVLEAIKSGIKTLAFTDHVPFPASERVEPTARMQYEETDDYLASIEYLKSEYGEFIDIKSGFEFEYIPEFEKHLRDLKSRTDFMVLGQHFITDETGKRSYLDSTVTDSGLEQYGKLVTEAIEKGLPDIIVHPDIFMRGRENWGEEERLVAIQICEAAAKACIPLEINMGEVGKTSRRVDKSLSQEDQIKQAATFLRVPCKEFWEIASQVGCMVLYGKDAHYPGQLAEDRDYEIVREKLGTELLEKLNFVTLAKDGKFVLKTSQKNQGISIEREEVETLATSPEIEVSNQSLETIMSKVKEKDGEKADDIS